MAQPQINRAMQARDAIKKTLRTAGIHQGMWARSATIERAESDKNGGFEWVLTTEKPTIIFDWERWDFVEEILLADGMLIPANGQVVLLDSHSRNSVRDVLGHVRDFSDTGSGSYAAKSGKVFFAEDSASVDARKKVEGNHITDGSVGYLPTKSIWVPTDHEVTINGRTFVGPVRVTYEWQLKEFSITPIGADILAKVRLLCGA